MSVHDHASFLKGSSLPPVFDVKHLDIPSQPIQEPKGQEHALTAGTTVRYPERGPRPRLHVRNRIL